MFSFFVLTDTIYAQPKTENLLCDKTWKMQHKNCDWTSYITFYSNGHYSCIYDLGGGKYDLFVATWEIRDSTILLTTEKSNTTIITPINIIKLDSNELVINMFGNEISYLSVKNNKKQK